MQRRDCTVKYEVYFFKSRYRLTCVFYGGFLMRHRVCTVKYDADPRGGSFLTSLGLPWGSFGDFCSYRATTVFYGVGSCRGHPAGRVGRVVSYTYYLLLILFAYLLNSTDYSLILFAYLHNLNVLLADT